MLLGKVFSQLMMADRAEITTGMTTLQRTLGFRQMRLAVLDHGRALPKMLRAGRADIGPQRWIGMHALVVVATIAAAEKAFVATVDKAGERSVRV